MADESPDRKILRSKAALERTQKAQEAVRAAAEKRERAQRLSYLDAEVDYYSWAAVERARRKGEDPETVARLERGLQLHQAERDAGYREWQEAEEEERQALEELAKASEEFATATVEPRVEAEKLRFEEHKLRATLSSASIVGIAATVGILFPSSPSSAGPSYIVILGASFFCLFISAILALGAMNKISSRVESTMISADHKQPGRLHSWPSRHTFTVGLVIFAVFILLNLLT